MPWINKASLALYIACIIVKGLARKTTACHATNNLKFGRCTAVLSSSLWLKHRNLSLERLRVGLRLHLYDSGASIEVYAFYWRPFITYIITLCSHWGYGQVFHYKTVHYYTVYIEIFYQFHHLLSLVKANFLAYYRLYSMASNHWQKNFHHTFLQYKGSWIWQNFIQQKFSHIL